MKSKTSSSTQPIPIPGLADATHRERFLLILAGVFVLVGGVTLHLAYPPFTLRHVSFVIFSFVIAFATAHVTLSRRLPKRDPLLLPTAAILSGWGLLMVGRVAPNFLPRQATWLLVATLTMLASTQLGQDLRWLRRYRYTWLVAGLALLAATLLLGVNPSGSGPRLWLSLGGAYLQPSEPLKLLMVVYLASYLAERRELLVSERWKIGRWRLPPLAYVGPLLVMFGLAALLLAAQQDLGTAMLFFFTFLSMLYLATGQWGYVAAGLVLFLLAGVVGYAGSARVALRVDGWLNPWAGAANWAFQTVQSLLAFGTGGIFGQGLGLGRPTYVPAVHTDFVFAAVGEAFGLVGLLAIIALYGILLLRGLRTAARARHPFERLLAAGLTAGLVIQAWVIMAANVKLAPIAGVTLPFLSYGGSSLLSTFIALGLLLRISVNWETDKLVHWEADRRATNLPIYPPEGRTNLPMLHIACALLLALALLAVACGYWTVARAEWLVAREDNPRRVAYEQRILRGRILDREGIALADVAIGPSGVVTRTCPVPEAAPVVGYASLRYGTGSIEAAFDEALRGKTDRSVWEALWADLLHRPPHGQDVRLTLDADLQRLAQKTLAEAGEAGAAILLDVRTGEVLAMASVPTFDPAQLDERWDQLREDPAAPLLNRATQGLYQPGAAFQTIVVAEALTEGLVDHLENSTTERLTETLAADNARLGCSTAPAEPHTLASAYAAACPAPIAALGERLEADGLAKAVERWHLTTPPSLEIPAESADWSREWLTTTAALRAEAIGQGKLTVSPLQMALVAATLANEGTMPALRLALQVESGEDGWQKTSPVGVPRTILAAAEAHKLLAAWRQCADDPSTRALDSARDKLGADMVGHWGIAIAGEGEPHAWFIGVRPETGEPRYATAVLIEQATEPERAIDVGAALLQAASR